jgi:hypothetical protein
MLKMEDLVIHPPKKMVLKSHNFKKRSLNESNDISKGEHSILSNSNRESPHNNVKLPK